MTLKLNSSTSGSVSIDAPASTTGGADVTFKLPVADGTANQVVKTDASGNLGWADNPTSNLTHLGDNAVATSGQNVELTTSLPATGWKRVTVMLKNVSQDSSHWCALQLGKADGTYYTSGYSTVHGYIAGEGTDSAVEYASTSGCALYSLAGNDLSGIFEIIPFQNSSTSNTYMIRYQLVNGTASYRFGASMLTGVDAAITRVRLHNYATAVFDAGSSSVMYEV